MKREADVGMEARDPFSSRSSIVAWQNEGGVLTTLAAATGCPRGRWRPVAGVENLPLEKGWVDNDRASELER